MTPLMREWTTAKNIAKRKGTTVHTELAKRAAKYRKEIENIKACWRAYMRDGQDTVVFDKLAEAIQRAGKDE